LKTGRRKWRWIKAIALKEHCGKKNIPALLPCFPQIENVLLLA